MGVGDEIDDFLLVDGLGEGAFAKVYLAHQKSLRRTVALKVSTARSEEAQTLAQLDHPNIVRVFDQRDVADGDLHLLYMEYVPGGTLEAVVERVRALPDAARSGKLLLEVIDAALAARGAEPPLDSLLRLKLDRASWVEAVCLLGSHLAVALEYAHAHNVLHRDVKPANVLLAENGRAKLADFNISWSSDVGDEGAEAYMGGSLPYMSPEQLAACSPFEEATAQDLDRRSDIYGLGVVLWELLTGELPFPEPAEGLGWKELFEHLTDTRAAGVPAETVAALPASVPPLVTDTLLACLAPERDARPATGTDLARRLELCLDPRVRALLTPATRGPATWLRRFPILTLMLVGLVPNALLSVLAIVYNQAAVLAGATDAQLASFDQHLLVINGLVFPVGIALMIWMTWPIQRAVRARERGERGTAQERSAARKWALRLGGGLAAVILPLWVIGGLAFPIWSEAQGEEASAAHYFHFTLSNGLFGLLSATVCFFLINFLIVRVLFPRLVEPGDVDEARVTQIDRLLGRIPYYFAACTSVPLVSVIVLGLWPGALRQAFLVLGLLGGAAFALSFRLSTVIRADLLALRKALH
ncbi:MAG: serine/threonine protein kinase [Deltaproteobacteria bacterium]|nr:serine/threonine protein kinase [Deltaproteobacteria bacterium]